MKRSILIAAMALISGASFAQTKTDTTKKQYVADQKRVYHVVLDLTFDQATIYTMNDEQLAHHPKLTGEQIGQFQDFKKDENNALWKQIALQADSDYRKWQADTAKAGNKRLKK
jgi:hypothetical protein